MNQKDERTSIFIPTTIEKIADLELDRRIELQKLQFDDFQKIKRLSTIN